MQPPGPVLLLGSVAGLSAGSAVSAQAYAASLFPSDPEMAVEVGGAIWTVRLSASDELGCDGRVTLSDGGRSQLLYDAGEDGFCDEPHFYVNWVGDLDRDGRLDLVATFSPKYSLHPRRLYLSGAAADGDLVGLVAFYDRQAM